MQATPDILASNQVLHIAQQDGASRSKTATHLTTTLVTYFVAVDCISTNGTQPVYARMHQVQ